MAKPRYGLYKGKLLRMEVCKYCKRYAVLINHHCKSKNKHKIKKYGKKQPSEKLKTIILVKQDYKCFYCFRKFGKLICDWKRNKLIVLIIHWDHINPFTHSSDNSDSNFAAACSVCNKLKSRFRFESIDEIRNYLKRRWFEKGYSSVLPLRLTIQTKEKTTKIL